MPRKVVKKKTTCIKVKKGKKKNGSKKIKSFSSKPEEHGDQATFKSYEAIVNQISSLLPGFCPQTTNLVESFPKVAQILGKIISTDDNLRLDVLSSIRKLVLHNTENEKERTVLSHYSKNFIPLFCNLYTSTKSVKQVNPTNADVLKFSETLTHPLTHTLAILETFKIYIKISPPEVVNKCASVCFEKIKNPDTSLIQRHQVLDLVVGLVPGLSAENMQLAISWALENINSEDRTVQKKSYRMLEEICACSSETSNCVVQNNMSVISDHLVKSLSSCNPISKAARLGCLENIIKKLDTRNDGFIISLLPETIFCTKATGQKAKRAAFSLLSEMARTYIKWNGQGAFLDFVVMLFPGLASSNAHLVSCSVLAINKVIFDFKDLVEADLLKILVDYLCLLLKSKSREIVRSGLSFFKSLLLGFSDRMDQFLKPLVSSLVSMKDDNRHHFRFKSKEVYIILVRKFGIEVLYELLPASHHRILNHIRKEEQRHKKKKLKTEKSTKKEKRNDENKSENGIEDLLRDTDSENDESNNDSEQEDKFYLKEDNGIIDFLDPSANQKLIYSNSDLKKMKKKSNSKDYFKVMPDGRLIIPSSEEAQELKINVKDAVNLPSDSGTKTRKRKISIGRKNDVTDDEDDDDDNDFDSEVYSKSSYKPGGKGIHRSIKKEKPKKKSTLPRKNFGTCKKSKGDKLKGNLEPYTYYPLDAKMINKRCKTNFQGIVKKRKC